MDPLLQLLLGLALILLAAKGAGYISGRLGQPAVLGELLAGLILGPTVLDMLHLPIFSDGHLGEVVASLAELGVLVLMFIAGLEVDVGMMLHSGRVAGLAGVLGVLAPVGLGIAASLPFGFALEQSLLVGLVLGATSVSISAQTMMELGVLRSRVGMALLGAAVVDDVLVILLFSLFTGLVVGEGGGVLTIVWTLVRMAGFLGLAIWLGARIVPHLAEWVDELPISEGVMALALIVTLLFSWGAEFLGGIATITGAFLAGLLFARSAVHERIMEGMHTLAYAFLVPIFFVSIGLEVNALAFGEAGVAFALAILGAALVSKVLGSGLGAWLGGFSGAEALRLGVGMTSRGEVGLILASVAEAAGLFGEGVFAAVVLMVLVTTLLTPLALRWLYPTAKEPQPERAQVPGG